MYIYICIYIYIYIYVQWKLMKIQKIKNKLIKMKKIK